MRGMLTPLELVLLFIISGLLLLCAWQSYHHERAMELLRLRWAPLPRASDLLEQSFELRRPARPAFESYGVDISVAPTIGIADTPGRLPSFTLREFGGVR
jgi:hypothetical protein